MNFSPLLKSAKSVTEQFNLFKTNSLGMLKKDSQDVFNGFTYKTNDVFSGRMTSFSAENTGQAIFGKIINDI